MLFDLDLMIKEEEFNKIGITELKFPWGEELLSLEPKQYLYDTNIKFEECLDKDYYKRYYGRFIEKEINIYDFMALRLVGDWMQELEFLVNTSSDRVLENEIILFFRELFKLDSFLLFFIHDEENIDKGYRVNTESELLDIIIRSFNWSTPEGVLITKL